MLGWGSLNVRASTGRTPWLGRARSSWDRRAGRSVPSKEPWLVPLWRLCAPADHHAFRRVNEPVCRSKGLRHGPRSLHVDPRSLALRRNLTAVDLRERSLSLSDCRPHAGGEQKCFPCTTEPRPWRHHWGACQTKPWLPKPHGPYWDSIDWKIACDLTADTAGAQLQIGSRGSNRLRISALISQSVFSMRPETAFRIKRHETFVHTSQRRSVECAKASAKRSYGSEP